MGPLLSAVAARQNGVFTRRQALDAGHTPDDIRHRLRSHRWIALRQGIYADARVLTSDTTDADRHRRRAAAALLGLGGRPVLSHRSAALMWDLPSLVDVPTEVALTVVRQHRRRSPGLELHTARTPTDHRASVDGLPVTTVARTVSDLARSTPFRDAVVALDAALQRRLCAKGDIDQVIADCPTWRGIARTKRVLAFAHGNAESPGESLSRVAMAAAGLPTPELQSELVVRGRRFRVDFRWPGHRVVGEFDGRVKYGDAADLWAEKQREDMIRDSGERVVRWVWSDVYPRADRMVERLARALA